MKQWPSVSGPTVSIIIPCYNAEKWVGEAIQSALAQSHSRTEVIVVDDGSTDGSLQLIRSFEGAIRWETGPNRGGCAARNRGLALASGEFVQFLDADDLLGQNCLAEKLQAGREAPDSCICCDWFQKEANGSITARQLRLTADSVVSVLAESIAINSPLHRRRDLARVGGFDERLPCCQERDLHLRLACCGVRFQRLQAPLVTVHKRAESVSSSYTRVLLEHKKIFQNAFDLLSASGMLTDARRSAFARALSVDGRRLYRRGMTDEAREYWRMAAEIDKPGFRAAYGSRTARALVRGVGAERAEMLIATFRGKKAREISPTS